MSRLIFVFPFEKRISRNTDLNDRETWSEALEEYIDGTLYEIGELNGFFDNHEDPGYVERYGIYNGPEISRAVLGAPGVKPGIYATGGTDEVLVWKSGDLQAMRMTRVARPSKAVLTHLANGLEAHDLWYVYRRLPASYNVPTTSEE